MPMIGARSNARGATDPNPRLQASHAARAFSIPLWVPMPMERLRANFFLQLHWIDVKGWGWEGPLPSRFCCYWCLLRPSQSQSQIQIKTEMFRKRSITYHTTSSILPFTGLGGHPGLSFALNPLFTPSLRLCCQLLPLMWMQVYSNF